MHYHGVPLEDISVRELLDGLEPIIYRHLLLIPTDFWLLIKTVVMMEGVGRGLDPEFDIFEVAQPYLRRFMIRLWLPSEWGPSVLRSATTMADLLIDLPRQTTRILGQVERGDLGLRIQVQELEQTTKRLETIANRVILAVLLAALILGLAMLIPRLTLEWPWSLLTWIIISAFLVATFLALWLIWSMLRSAR
jgi:ubiquinone biosynthesis protein